MHLRVATGAAESGDKCSHGWQKVQLRVATGASEGGDRCSRSARVSLGRSSAAPLAKKKTRMKNEELQVQSVLGITKREKRGV